MTITKQRKRDGQQRRRELSDAAIEVIADMGSRGLSHQRVDRSAGVPDGTTSYYYRTRAALLQAVAERVADIDAENLRSAIADADPADPPFTRLAQLVMTQSHGKGLQLNKARHELLLASARDPALAEAQQAFTAQVRETAQDSVHRLQTVTDVGNPEITAAQSAALSTFISGMFTRFIAGDSGIGSAEQLARILHALAAALPRAYRDGSQGDG